jgi:hypothetical protein
VRTYAHALGVELPPGLLVVVQRVVHEGRQLNGLLQAFDASNGDRRYVVHLALSVNGRQVSDRTAAACAIGGLRHQRLRGRAVLSVRWTWRCPGAGARLWPSPPPSCCDQRCHAHQRIEDEKASWQQGGKEMNPDSAQV